MGVGGCGCVLIGVDWCGWVYICHNMALCGSGLAILMIFFEKNKKDLSF